MLVLEFYSRRRGSEKMAYMTKELVYMSKNPWPTIGFLGQHW